VPSAITGTRLFLAFRAPTSTAVPSLEFDPQVRQFTALHKIVKLCGQALTTHSPESTPIQQTREAPTSTLMPSSSLNKPPKRDVEGTKWFEHAVNGGTLILEGINQATQFAPVPFLQQAADAALTIVKVVQVCCSHDALISALYV